MVTLFETKVMADFNFNNWDIYRTYHTICELQLCSTYLKAIAEVVGNNLKKIHCHIHTRLNYFGQGGPGLFHHPQTSWTHEYYLVLSGYYFECWQNEIFEEASLLYKWLSIVLKLERNSWIKSSLYNSSIQLKKHFITLEYISDNLVKKIIRVGIE